MKSVKRIVHLASGPGMEARVLKRAILRISASKPYDLYSSPKVKKISLRPLLPWIRINKCLIDHVLGDWVG